MMINVRPAPYPDEDFQAYILRVSAENGYPSARTLLAAAGLPDKGRDPLSWSGRDLAALARVIGRPIEVLLALAPRARSRNTLVFGGHAVPRDAVERRSLAVCPACLAERRYVMRTWRLKLISGCAVHGCALSDRCPRCGATLTWRRPELFTCRCGYDLLQASAPAMSPALRTLSAHLTALVDGGSGTGRPEPVPAALAGLSVGDAFAVLEWLHRIRARASGGEPERALSAMARPERLHAMEAVAGLVAEWPEAFWDLLDRLGIADDAGCVKRRCRPIYDRLFAPANRRRYRPLREAFVGFVADRFGGQASRRGRPLALRSMKSDDTVTLQVAAKTIGLSREVIRRQIHQGQLPAKIVRSGRSHAYRIPLTELIQRDVLTRLERAAARARTKKAAAKTLGVCPATVDGLIRAGRLDPRSDNAAADLLARCEVRDRSPAGPPPPDLVTFRTAVIGTLRQRRLTIAEVVGAVADGRLGIWVARDGKGLDRLRFARHELAAYGDGPEDQP